jgi:hypothetical protein
MANNRAKIQPPAKAPTMAPARVPELKVAFDCEYIGTTVSLVDVCDGLATLEGVRDVELPAG